LVVVIVEITAAALVKITVTATHGGTSFSTLWRYSVDHTIRAGKWQTFHAPTPLPHSSLHR
jgi:hypothetical protein